MRLKPRLCHRVSYELLPYKSPFEELMEINVDGSSNRVLFKLFPPFNDAWRPKQLTNAWRWKSPLQKEEEYHKAYILHLRTCSRAIRLFMRFCKSKRK